MTDETPRTDPSGDPTAATPTHLPVLPVRDTVVFPGAVLPVLVGRERSKRLVRSLVDAGGPLLVLASTRSGAGEPGPDEVAGVGTVGRLVQVFRLPDGNFRLVVRGESRVRIGPYVQTHPFLSAEIEHLTDAAEPGARLEALQRTVAESLRRLAEFDPELSERAVSEAGDAAAVADLASAALNLETDVAQSLLETLDVAERLDRLARLAAAELEILEVSSRIEQSVASELEDGRREMLLRRQLEAIRRELGETGDDSAELEDLRSRLDDAGLPEEARGEVDRELARLERLPAASPERQVITTYLDWLVRVPWNVLTEDTVDLAGAREVLDADHHGLGDVKERILEYLAVRSLRSDVRGPLLLFVGAPGVGKTSLGRSIARALGREFVRTSLGGVRDEAEIRGHRRTYVGALPGRIVQGLVRAGTRNPVVVLDEVDKIGADFRGDPAAALLEVLDPEQNHDFRDHYLDVPVDLSQVLFVATANVVHTIPPALLDRLEVVEIAGYTIDEKVAIGRDHLLPKQLEAHGLDDERAAVPDESLELVAARYTREAGVRTLDRSIATLVRKAARRIVEGDERRLEITPDLVRELLGPERFADKSAAARDEIGMVAGLAVTGAGGDVLFVEAALVAGSGELTITGQLGPVMEESARAAVTYVRSRAGALGLEDGWAAERDIHLHVPEGAVPKDGPSAGVTLTTALASAATGTAVRHDVAMTGEVTLRGAVLPIGGLREKLVAAHRAGMRTVLVPADNAKDLVDVPERVRAALEVIPVDHMDRVLEVALVPDGSPEPAS